MNRARKTLLRFATAVMAAVAAPLLFAGLENVSYTNAETNWIGGELILKFTNTSQVATFTMPGPGMVRILAVGGGGGGGSGAASTSVGAGGGGGGGGFVDTNDLVLVGGEYTVVVGAGGASSGGTAVAAGESGGDSLVSFGGGAIIRALGGGGGGSRTAAAGSGGSGGGGSKGGATAGQALQPQSLHGGYGNDGGAGSHNRVGAGGGGAGGGGGDTVAVGKAGAGGAGRASDISGEAVYYAGGGGGGARSHDSVSEGGAGGKGGGGDGGFGTSSDDHTAAKAGEPGTGGGGGGGNNAAAGGKGGDGIVIVRVKSALDGDLVKPSLDDVYYTGEAIEKIRIDGYEFAFETAEGTMCATNAGTYHMHIKLADGFKWADGTRDEIDGDWTIVKATNYIENLSIANWYSGNPPAEPTCDYAFGEPVYEYATSRNGAYSGQKPDSPGRYYLRASIEGSDNYDGVEHVYMVAPFTIYEPQPSPTDSLGLSAKFTITNDVDDVAATNAYFVVRVREDVPSGFEYSQAEADGSDIRFFDESGAMLPSEKYSWNTHGESVFYVRVSPIARRGVFYMVWGRTDGSGEPSGASSENWSALTELDAGEYLRYGETVRDARYMLRNRWVVTPSLSKTIWNEGETPAVVVNGRSLTAESVAPQYVVLPEGTVVDEMPTARGVYEAVFSCPATSLYAALTEKVLFSIHGKTPYSDLSGESGGMTASGRVLLMNDDRTGAEAVAGQGYSDTNLSAAAHWEFDEMSSDSINIGRYMLMPGLSSALYTQGGARLWRLENCRHGNIYRRNTADETSRFNHLPWSTLAASFTNSAQTAADGRDAGAVQMLNTTNAVIYSSCFEEGVGTVYFDAVNTAVSNGEFFNIVVEISTNVLGGAQPPYDANLEVVNVVTNGLDEIIATTNKYVYSLAEWTAVPVIPLKRDGSEHFVGGTATTELSLNIANSGTAANFYRVYVPLDIRVPVRFRIRRNSCHPNFTEEIDSPDALVSIDNIIVSYPAMRVDLEPYGFFDESKKGKATLGWEAAFSTPFPAAGADDVFARARNAYSLNSSTNLADAADIVTLSRMWYRWRYLDQTNSTWKSVLLNHKSSAYDALSALEFPRGPGGDPLPGDVEFWYETYLQAPFYEYFDYSGTGLGVPGYSENIPVVTNRSSGVAASGAAFESCGTNWFVRLREHASVCERVNLVWKSASGGATNTVPMEIVLGNTFRGYLQTKEPDRAGIDYRFETVNAQVPGDTAFAFSTNCWISADVTNALPITGMVQSSDTNGWSHIPCDAATGYLLFQLDHETRALTVVHADYQNFNYWNDAKSDKFSGCSEEGTNVNKRGVSSKARTMTESFADWTDMPSGNAFWTENFDTTLTQEYGYYTNFTATTTPNGWDAGPGMWCYSYYKDSSSKRALQMEGNGFGYIQMTHTPTVPRGLESISLKARLAQFVELSDFSWYDAPYKSQMTNYTFLARGVFDLERNKSFGGNASLSLVACYTPGKGCYEFRVEQVGGGTAGMDRTKQRLSLYRWSYDEYGSVEEELLGSVDKANLNWPETTSITNGMFVPMFISVSNATHVAGAATNDVVCISAGLMRGEYRKDSDSADDVKGLGVRANLRTGFESGKSFMVLRYRDASDKKHKSGTYGFLAANCTGVVLRPVKYPDAVAHPATFTALNAFESQGVDDSLSSPIVVISTNGCKECYTTLENGEWYVAPGRMNSFVTHLNGDPSSAYEYWGASAGRPSQQLRIYTAPASGTSGWTLAASTNFTNFGSFAGSQTFTFYTTPDTHVKIAAGGTRRDRRTDIVIDDIDVRQWRGDDWENAGAFVPNWVSETVSSAHTNFIFGSGWIKNRGVLLSAKRTAPGTGSYIRSPLFDGSASDGSFDRGTGLGMFAFSYANAQTNANLLFQIATNVSYSTVNSINAPDSAAWHTVTNFSFAGLSDAERQSGARSVYLGMHGVKGVMRLIVDPKLVNAVSNANFKVSDAFGEVRITGVVCRDEPVIDESSWWGWNMRTLGPDADNKDAEKRMYLADLNGDYAQTGLSLALNNSITNDIAFTKVNATDDKALFKEHQPFVQTPFFATNIVGEVSFKARKYGSGSGNAAQPAQVTVYGSKTGTDGAPWTRLAAFVVSNDVYTSYSYKTEPNDSYAAFRLAVTGVPGVSDKNIDGNREPEGYSTPVRVLIDEVVVSEAVRVRMAFRNVGAFRSLPTDNILNDTGFVPGVPGEERQPLCNESWGIQCEVYPAQLADEIDLEKTPQVKLLWFEGLSPWGYENWRDRAKSAWLARATDTNLVYRSSYVTSPAAVMDPSTWPGTVVQYVLEVIYYQIGSNQPITNRLSSSEWTKPAWYRGIDYNRDRGRNESFAAYNILDTVAPHWAWINEANIFGGYDDDGQNDDRRVQYIEVAVPAEADISSWGLNLLVAHDTTGIVYTNRLATFGEDNLAGRKRNLVGMESNMVFRVVASPLARQYQQLDASKGEIDGVWRTPALGTPEFTQSGEIDAFSPVGIQLVRGSGILEHEIVALGTNYYSRADMPEDLRESHNPSNVAEFLNARLADSAFIAVPEDSFSAAASVGVFRDSGETPGAWTNVFGKTPGRINGGQTINPNHPTPNGSSLIVYANLAPSGHILQSLGNNIVNTNGNVILIVPKGLVGGTNITYTIDKWYELDSVTTNAVAASAVKSGDRQYVLTVADNCSNNVTVVAAAKVSEYLTNLGVTENNRYTPAVMEWLREGRNAWGEPWANTDADTVRLADFIGASGSVITNLSLTEMYWFDMDPTVGDLALKAHFSKAPTTKTVVANEQTGALATNVNIGVFMMVTNRATGEAWTPYVLRGLDPGSKSWDMTNETASAWTSVTFKVTGIMPTEHVDIGFFSKDWIPLRWFVFQPDSFRPLTASKNPGVTFIDVVDPHSPSSPGYGAGWWRYPELTPYFKWDIDERLKPYTVESLKQDNDI